jgi:3-oxoacyl-[acyl-carrier protein] reductase
MLTPISFHTLLQGQRAIVTGGTSGIGLAIARAFALHGMQVIVFGTNASKGQLAVEALLSEIPGASVAFRAVDVANKAAVDTAIDALLKEYGGIDVLVNNAGITRDQLLLKMSEEDWDAVMDVNVKSCYNMCHALIRPMIKARSGAIINVSSVVALTGNAGQTNYCAAKAAMIGFTRALAKEVASRTVRVNCLVPGFIETPMTEALTDLQKAGILAKIPLGHMGEPSDIANMALFLASPLARYITGQLITVDGGMT